MKTNNVWLWMFFLLTKRKVTCPLGLNYMNSPYMEILFIGSGLCAFLVSVWLSPLPCYPLLTCCYWQFRNSGSLGLWFDGKNEDKVIFTLFSRKVCMVILLDIIFTVTA